MSQSSARRLTKGGRPFPTPRAARGPRKGRRQPGVDRRADSKLFLFKKKKKLCAARSGVFFFSLFAFFPRLPSPFFLLKVSFFFFFFPPSLTAWLIQLQCQSTFFSSSSSFK